MRDHLAQARNLLCLANRKGIRIPREVVTAVIETERACDGGTPALELEARFWDAYGLLRRTIEPATKRRRFYRIVFYCALGLMLLVQAGFLIGSQVHEHSSRRRRPAGAARRIATRRCSRPPATFSRESRSLCSDRARVRRRLSAAGAVRPARRLRLRAASALRGRQHAALRRRLRVRYTLRLNIGVLGGLAVGWFIDPTAEGSMVANLSPLALAFVAGYGSDLLFAVLDRIVGAFATQPPATREAETSRLRSEPLGAFTAGLAGAESASQRGKHGNGLDAEPAMAHERRHAAPAWPAPPAGACRLPRAADAARADRVARPRRRLGGLSHRVA